MFGFGHSAEEKAVAAFNKTRLGKGLVAHLNEYFGYGKVYAKFPDEAKSAVISKFYERIFDIINSESPFEKMRMSLADEVYYISQFMVLLPERRREPNSRFLSAELKRTDIKMRAAQ